MAEALYFENNVEGLFVKALGPRLGAEARAQLRAVGLDLDRPHRPGYPAQVWEQALLVCAAALYPGRPTSEALFEVGRSFLSGFEQTMFGAATVERSQLMGLERTLQRTGRMVRASNNFTELQVLQPAEGQFELSASLLPEFRGTLPPAPVEFPHYLRGLFTSLLAKLGAQGEIAIKVNDPIARAYTLQLRVRV